MSDRTEYVVTVENVTSDQEIPVSDVIAGVLGDLGDVSRTDAGALRFEVSDVDYHSAIYYAGQIREGLDKADVTSAFMIHVCGTIGYNARLVRVSSEGKIVVNQADEAGEALVPVSAVAEALAQGEGAVRDLLASMGA